MTTSLIRFCLTVGRPELDRRRVRVFTRSTDQLHRIANNMAWKKGQSGNPAGRAVEKPFADALRMEIKAAGEDHQQLREIARKLLEKASQGDMQAINCLADRLDGRPAQALEVNTSESFVMRLPEPARRCRPEEN